MKTPATVLPLILSLAALGVAGYVLATAPAAPTDADARRLADLEAEVASLRETLAQVRSEDAQVGPRLSGSPGARPGDEGHALDTLPGGASAGSANEGAGILRPDGVVAASPEALEALVEAQVERKAKEVQAEMRLKENKKPAFKDFAKALELTERQHAAAEEALLRVQEDAFRLLDIPTADGMNFREAFAKITIQAAREPGKDPGWGKLLGAFMREKVPGTDTTYAAQWEAAKQDGRERLKRILNEEQFQEFQAWGPDPIEIRGVHGSPRAALIAQIEEQAAAEGVEIPAHLK